jgi:ABC-type branched-subunit amino acid transport system ATPase component
MTYEEEQRVTLAQAMANEPPLSWLMNLQENLIQIIQKIYGLLQSLEGYTVLMVSEYILFSEIANETFNLDNGSL